MYHSPARQILLRTTCRDCGLHRTITTTRQFHGSSSHEADKVTPSKAPKSKGAKPSQPKPPVPKTRDERSKESFRQISQLPKQSTTQKSGFRNVDLTKTGSSSPSQASQGSVARSATIQRSSPSQTGRRPGSYERAPSNNMRGNNSGRGGVRGGARGGFRGSGRGGRFGGVSDRPAHRQKAKRSTGNEFDDVNSEDAQPTNYDIMEEQDGDLYNSTDELRNYAQAVDLIDQYRQHQVGVDARLKYKDKPDKDALSPQQAPKARGEFDDIIKEAMDNLIEVDEREIPRHIPQSSWSTAADKGMSGDVPLGDAGMVNLVEDSLRSLALRQGHEWRSPRELAEKLGAGNFMKFTNEPEKSQVMFFAESNSHQSGQAEGTLNVGFEPPTEEAKAEVVKRLASGQYRDPSDSGIRGKHHKQFVRILNGNSSYFSGDKNMLLQTIREIMPEPAPRK